jgi:hypothetical protein
LRSPERSPPDLDRASSARNSRWGIGREEILTVIIAIIAFAAFCYFVVKVEAMTLFHACSLILFVAAAVIVFVSDVPRYEWLKAIASAAIPIYVLPFVFRWCLKD